MSRLVVDFVASIPMLGPRPSVEQHWEMFADCTLDAHAPGRVSRPPVLVEVVHLELTEDRIELRFADGSVGFVPRDAVLSYYTEPLK